MTACSLFINEGLFDQYVVEEVTQLPTAAGEYSSLPVLTCSDDHEVFDDMDEEVMYGKKRKSMETTTFAESKRSRKMMSCALVRETGTLEVLN